MHADIAAIPRVAVASHGRHGIDDSMGYAEKVRNLMRSRGLTQKALAEAIGTDQTQVSRWLSSPKKGPSPFYLLRIARALGTTADYLIDDARTEPEALPTLTEDERRILDDARIIGIPEARRRLLLAREGRPPGTPIRRDEPAPVPPETPAQPVRSRDDGGPPRGAAPPSPSPASADPRHADGHRESADPPR